MELSSDLKWNKHVSKTVAKAKQTPGVLRRNLRSCPHDIEDLAYKTFVLFIVLVHSYLCHMPKFIFLNVCFEGGQRKPSSRPSSARASSEGPQGHLGIKSSRKYLVIKSSHELYYFHII